MVFHPAITQTSDGWEVRFHALPQDAEHIEAMIGYWLRRIGVPEATVMIAGRPTSIQARL